MALIGAGRLIITLNTVIWNRKVYKCTEMIEVWRNWVGSASEIHVVWKPENLVTKLKTDKMFLTLRVLNP